ncbi:6762_t:CDS:2, partial [Entrophospora sp. SA101]
MEENNNNIDIIEVETPEDSKTILIKQDPSSDEFIDITIGDVSDDK